MSLDTCNPAPLNNIEQMQIETVALCCPQEESPKKSTKIQKYPKIHT